MLCLDTVLLFFCTPGITKRYKTYNTSLLQYFLKLYCLVCGFMSQLTYLDMTYAASFTANVVYSR